MKKYLVVAMATGIAFGWPQRAKADLFGADAVVLTQILANAIQQLNQMMALVRSGNDTLSLLSDINRGINDSLGLVITMKSDANAGLYGDLATPEQALKKLHEMYGDAVEAKNAGILRSSDRIISEALSVNASIHQYTAKLDMIGEDIKRASHFVSPGGAQKLTAESLGVLIHAQNEALRTQAMGVKLSAQSLAAETLKEKEETRVFLKSADMLKSAMKAQSTSFQTPKF